MNNLQHLSEHWPGNVQIEVVTLGPGIELLMISKTTQSKRIEGFKNAGILFSVCMNTMRAWNIQKEAILSAAGFIPSGIAVVMKQEEGWSYVKGGF